MPGRRLALAAVALVAAGCARYQVLQGRIDAIGDAGARTVVRDLLWRHGSIYAWADLATMEAEAEVVSHGPGGDAAWTERWRLDVQEAALTRTAPEAALPPARRPGFEAVAAAMLAAPLVPVRPGRTVRRLDPRVGPAGTPTWNRLRVTDPGGDVTVLETGAATGRLDAAVLAWRTMPWPGAPLRVALDDWRTVGAVRIAHRWRLYGADLGGRAAGPTLVTVRLRNVTTRTREAP